MGLKEIQELVHKWATQFNPPYWPISNQFFRLSEEVGELGRELNHADGTKKKKSEEKPSSIEDELADVIFTAVCMANSKNIDLDAAFKNMVENKLYGRDKNRFDNSRTNKGSV